MKKENIKTVHKNLLSEHIKKKEMLPSAAILKAVNNIAICYTFGHILSIINLINIVNT